MRWLFVALLAAGPAVAAAEDLEYYSERIKVVAHSVVETINPSLDDHAREIIGDIEVVTPLTWETNADARRAFGNRRLIEFNAGFLAVTDWLALAMIADWAGHAGCLREYTEYLSTITGHNSRRIFRGKTLHFVQDFATYAAETRGHCEGALQDPVFDQRKTEIRDEILDSVVTTVLLHEMAHHVLDHVSGNPDNLVQHRMREIEADRWAINTAVAANYDLRTSVPLFLFLAATGGGTLEDEIRSSHPASLLRVRDLLVQTRELLDKRDPLRAHLMDASIEDLNRSLN